jgi:integrase
MPRTITDAPLTTRAARERLMARHQPYWRGMEAGAALGYRKGATGGQWVVRLVDPLAGGGYRQTSLGRADDALKADGVEVYDYRQAEGKARDWIARQHRIRAGMEPEPVPAQAASYTVADAVADYLTEFAARGGKSLLQTRQTAKAHIMPALGALPVGRLTRERVKQWHRGLATVPARMRAKAGETKYREAGTDPDAPRRRRATANRVLTVLKAALNNARTEGKVLCPPDPWAGVKPFREANAPKVRYLLDEEVRRLVNACPPDFRELVMAALLTGMRYGELSAMKAGDFDPQAGTVSVARSKGGKARHIVLTDEGRALFTQVTAGKASAQRMLGRDGVVKAATKDSPAITERRVWGTSDQFRAMHAACSAARIIPAISFHILRHTYASRLAMRGVPIPVIAAQLGHADTRMTEQHYAHLSPSYVADTVRAAFGTLGVVASSNVALFANRGGAA